MAPKTIDDYIAEFSPEVQSILERMRATIRKAAPDAEEKISYRIPTFTLKGNLVHFAAFKNHIGFYPPVRGDAQLRKETSVYANERGNLRFPLDKPMPYTLITKLVKIRVRENLERAAAKGAKRKSTAPRSLPPKPVSGKDSAAVRGGGINRIVVTDG
jgi:uncharacterized protein YdhG (YjbR/CyaY superfamily)